MARRLRSGVDSGSRRRLRYTKARREWQIYWRDRNLKFHAYDLVPPTANVESLFEHVDADPTGIFWG